MNCVLSGLSSLRTNSPVNINEVKSYKKTSPLGDKVNHTGRGMKKSQAWQLLRRTQILKKLGQETCCEFKAGLGYIRSKPIEAAEWDHSSEIQKEGEKEIKKEIAQRAIDLTPGGCPRDLRRLVLSTWHCVTFYVTPGVTSTLHT